MAVLTRLFDRCGGRRVSRGLWFVVLVSGAFCTGTASALATAAPNPAPVSPPLSPSSSLTLGRLERESVDEALAALGLAIEPNPRGKTVGQIYVVNQEVFSRRDWLFQLFNVFHRTTRSEILRRELLVKPGQPYDELLVEETIRNLQSPPPLVITNRTTFNPPELSSVVALVPVKSSRPGAVDLLAVTRDVWSLRLNTNFEFQQSTLSYLATSFSENNLFGWRKYLSVGFEMDQGRAGVGPTYFDPNIAGTRLTLLASAVAWYARDSRAYEGDNEQFSLRYPLYALANRWGGGVDVTHQDAVVRSFRGNQLRLVDLVATPSMDQVPYIYRRKIVTVDVSVVRSFGNTVIQRITLGHRVDSRRSDVLADFPGSGNGTPTFVGGAAHAVIGCSLQLTNAVAAKSKVNVESMMSAERVRDLHAPELLADSRVRAVGVGSSYDQPGQAAILLFVGAGTSAAGMLGTIDGVRTQIISGSESNYRGMLSDEETRQAVDSTPARQIMYAMRGGEMQRAQSVRDATARSPRCNVRRPSLRPASSFHASRAHEETAFH